MSKLNTTGIANDIALELEQMRDAAAQAQGLRLLGEFELSWVSGGDGQPSWDNSTPPSP